MRHLRVALALATVVLALPPSATAAGVFDPVGDCIHNFAAWPSNTTAPTDGFLVHAPSTVRQPGAEATAQALRAHNVVGTYLAGLQIPALTLPGQSGPYPIFLDPDYVVPDSDGLTEKMCEPPGSAVVVNGDLAPPGRRDAVVAHELFHAGQFVAAGKVIGGSWWGEATATWAETLFGFRDPEGFLPAFADHPELALDDVAPANTNHRYGAYVFVQWLMRNGVRWGSIKTSFASIGGGLAPTPAASGAFGGAGVFGRELASFWADMTRDVPTFGRQAKMTPGSIPMGGHSFHVSLAPKLGARLLALKVPAGAGRTELIVDTVPANVEVWVNLGEADGFERIGSGDDLHEHFCAASHHLKGWRTVPPSGQLRVAIVSTGPAAPGAASLNIDTIADAKPCPHQREIRLGAAIGDLRLGMSRSQAARVAKPGKAHSYPIGSPFGKLTVIAYREHRGGGLVTALFLKKRIALLWETNQQLYATRAGIEVAEFRNKVEYPGSTKSDIVDAYGVACDVAAHAPNGDPDHWRCRDTGPAAGRFTIFGVVTEGCDITVDDCGLPRDDYVLGIGVATRLGAKLTRFVGL